MHKKEAVETVVDCVLSWVLQLIDLDWSKFLGEFRIVVHFWRFSFTDGDPPTLICRILKTQLPFGRLID
jgi:hypothetical protein